MTGGGAITAANTASQGPGSTTEAHPDRRLYKHLGGHVPLRVTPVKKVLRMKEVTSLCPSLPVRILIDSAAPYGYTVEFSCRRYNQNISCLLRHVTSTNGKLKGLFTCGPLLTAMIQSTKHITIHSTCIGVAGRERMPHHRGVVVNVSLVVSKGAVVSAEGYAVKLTGEGLTPRRVGQL